MPVHYNLPLRRDVIAKIVYNALIHNKNPSYRKYDLESPEYIYKEGNLEYWWNISIKTPTKISHNITTNPIYFFGIAMKKYVRLLNSVVLLILTFRGK